MRAAIALCAVLGLLTWRTEDVQRSVEYVQQVFTAATS
jgi:hypothetical protein